MDSSQTTKPAAHILPLDGIRGVAISLVLLGHYLFFKLDDGLARNLIDEFGKSGVTLFFVLSGYLISRLLLREEDKNQRIDLGRFYTRRAIRLFPALWLYLGTVFILWLCGLIQNHPWYSFISSLFYTRNLVGQGHETNHLWSLAVEEHFYLVWPLLLIVIGRAHRVRLVVCLLGIVLVKVWRWYALGHGYAHAGSLYIRTDFRFDGLLIGCALALWERIAPDFFKRTLSMRVVPAALGLSSLAVFSVLLVLQAYGFGSAVAGSTPVAFAAAGMIAAATAGHGLWCRALRVAPLLWLGRVSYGLYLWQQLFFHGPVPSGLDDIRSNTVFAFAAIFGTASLSYYCLERPLLRWKDARYQPRPTGGHQRDGTRADHQPVYTPEDARAASIPTTVSV
jgi:peptidoglycan/LPS O-acetylase OafA/YrhL